MTALAYINGEKMSYSSVTGHCRHCAASAIQFVLIRVRPISVESGRRSTKVATHEAIGICTGCDRPALFYLRVHHQKGYGVRDFNEDTLHVNLTDYSDAEGNRVSLNGQIPAPTKPDIPAHLPENVHRAFEDGEKSFLAGHWNQAATSFGKAIDRGITPFIDDHESYKKLKRPMLGQKLDILEKLNLLPPAMLAWIGLVKENRNFALHDEDMDFDSKEDVETTRKFCRLLLEYLYTLPEEIERAKVNNP